MTNERHLVHSILVFYFIAQSLTSVHGTLRLSVVACLPSCCAQHLCSKIMDCEGCRIVFLFIPILRRVDK